MSRRNRAATSLIAKQFDPTRVRRPLPGNAGLYAMTWKQPWAWAVTKPPEPVRKPVENRSWPAPSWLTELAIHAGARSGWDEDGEDSPLVRTAWTAWAKTLPPMNVAGRLRRESLFIDFSAIVAVAEGITCHHATECSHICPEPEDWDGRVLPCEEFGGECINRCSAWSDDDRYHWSWSALRVLSKPVPCRGYQKLWTVPEDTERAVRAQLEARHA